MNTLMHFKDFVTEITASNSRLHKQAVLQKYKDDKVIKRYLQIAFDPYCVYGISAKKLSKEITIKDAPNLAPLELFIHLSNHNTGRDFEIAVCQATLSWVASYGNEYAELLAKLICKDLSIGCDVKTINKEIPGLIPEFNVQLANKYFDKHEYVDRKSVV